MMLRKVVTKEGKDWDKLLPYVLFAYREVPHTSTDFSPFELIYGHNVSGLMAVLKEAWESAESQDTSGVGHIMQIREQLQEMADLVYQNTCMAKAQADQKRWYDRNARFRKFELETKSLCYCQHQPASYWHNGKGHMRYSSQ